MYDDYVKKNLLSVVCSLLTFLIFADNQNAVIIEGNLSFEDGDEIRILASNVQALKSNADFENSSQRIEANAEQNLDVQTLYIKLDDLHDKRISAITRLSLLNPGKVKIVLFDSSTKKYSAFKNTFINPKSNVLERLRVIFGEENVVLK